MLYENDYRLFIAEILHYDESWIDLNSTSLKLMSSEVFLSDFPRFSFLSNIIAIHKDNQNIHHILKHHLPLEELFKVCLKHKVDYVTLISGDKLS